MKENYFYEIQSKELRSRKMPVNETFSLDENLKQALETGRNRLLVTGVMFMIVFVTIAIRLIELSAFGVGKQAQFSLNIPTVNLAAERSDIIDRNGIVLATSLPTASLYADPKDILNPEETADKLAGVFSELNPQELLIKLKSKSRFVWINRTLTPEEQYAVIALGLPGIFFRCSMAARTSPPTASVQSTSSLTSPTTRSPSRENETDPGSFSTIPFDALTSWA